MKEVISIKYGWNTIALAEIMYLGHQVQNLQDVKTHTSWLQNLKILLTFQGHKNKNRHGQNFWKLNFFLSEKKRLYRYYQNKNQLEVTSSSYINLRMKLLIKSYLIAQKMGKSEILCFLGCCFSLFL